MQEQGGEQGKHWAASSRRSPALVVLVGPPGTGKSHLARRLAERIPMNIVETDEIRGRIASPPSFSRAESGRVYLTAHRLISQLLLERHDVVFDATNLYERGRRTLRGIAEKSHARMLVVHTVAPEPVVEERLRRRKQGVEPLDRSLADWDVYHRMKGEMQQIRQPHLVVDTSRELEPAIDAIVHFILDQT